MKEVCSRWGFLKTMLDALKVKALPCEILTAPQYHLAHVNFHSFSVMPGCSRHLCIYKADGID